MVHYDEGDKRGFYDLAIPDTLVVHEVDGSGNYGQLHNRVRLAQGYPRGERPRMCPNERAALSDFLCRAKGNNLTWRGQAEIVGLTDKAGIENRAVVQIAIEEVPICGHKGARRCVAKGSSVDLTRSGFRV